MVQYLPHATLASGSCLRCASNTASLIWSQILSVEQYMSIFQKSCRHTKKNDIMVIAFSPISLTVVFSRLHSSSVPSILFPLFLLQYKTWPSSPVDFSKRLNDLQSRSFKSHISFCFRPMTSFPRT